MSEMLSLERDRISRERIVTEIDKNFFVEAGAGSGKTTMLVNRMTAMVEAGIPIGKICAITFTKAAAGEFYERFQKLLIERSNPDCAWEDKGQAGQLPCPTDRTRERCAEALKNIDLCFMGTIDSFCQMILSEHPSEARIPSDAAVASDQEVETLFKQQYVKILSGEYGKELTDLAAAFCGMHRNAEEVFVRGEAMIMEKRNARFHYPQVRIADMDRMFSRERESLIRLTAFLKDHKELRFDSEKKSAAAWDKIEKIHKELQKNWNANMDSVLYTLKNLSELRLIPESTEHYERELSEWIVPGGKTKKWLECRVNEEGGIVWKLKELQYSISMMFLDKCTSILEQAMREKGILTYFDAQYYLCEMLRRDAKSGGTLIRYIYERHSYYLIDEFQDTNPLQAEIFFCLTAEDPVPCWSDCVPRPGSLFIVGDPKQSIYRFRNADVAAFLRVKALFEKKGGTVLALPRNFRSSKMLCEHFNQVFTKLLPEETEDQSRFEEIPVPEDTEDEFRGIYSYRAYTGKAGTEHPDETDPIQIAGIIETLVGRDEYRIRTKRNEPLRKIRYSDIMVITKNKGDLGPIMAHLQEREIPTRVEGKVLFGANKALNAVFQIYRALADRNDPGALYGALTGILFGRSKEEITKYREEGGTLFPSKDPDPESFRDSAARRTAEDIRELRRLLKKAERLSPAALFSMIMEELRIYRVADVKDLEVICYTLELLRNAESKGKVVSLKDGVVYLSDLIRGTADEERCLSLKDDPDAVHMANLHKVKGLEAPVIILASGTQTHKPSSYRIEHLKDGTEGFIFFLSRKDEEGYDRGKYFETDTFPDQEAAEAVSSDAENDRKIYVAATRARNVLVICDTIQGKNSTSVWDPILTENTPDFFETVKNTGPVTKEKPVRIEADELYREAGETCALNDRSLEKATYAVENPSRVHLSSKMAEEQEVLPIMGEDLDAAFEEDREAGKVPSVSTSASERSKAFPKGTSGLFPALLGTMTHKLMEMLVSAKNRVDAEQAVQEIIREYRTPATEEFEKDLKPLLLRVAEQIRNGGYPQETEVPRDILNTLLQAEEVFCEVPFCCSEEGEDGWIIRNGIMDVVYRKDGKWHIVDYKTNADGSDLDRKYRGQLQAYIRAFRELTGEDADAFTYHIDI